LAVILDHFTDPFRCPKLGHK